MDEVNLSTRVDLTKPNQKFEFRGGIADGAQLLVQLRFDERYGYIPPHWVDVEEAEAGLPAIKDWVSSKVPHTTAQRQRYRFVDHGFAREGHFEV